MSSPDSFVVHFPLPTRRATKRLARNCARHLVAGDLLILSGNLGAGKTFWVRALCRALGLPERIAVTSPTFNLMNEITTEPPILHVDLFRLTSEREVADLGLREYRDLGHVVVVEWGEPYVEVLGGDALVMSLSLGPRRATLSSTGPRSRTLLEACSLNLP